MAEYTASLTAALRRLATDIKARVKIDDFTTALATKVNSSTYTAGIAAKADLAGGLVPVSQIPVVTAAKVSDFTEAAQDAVAAFLVQGSNVTLSHNDAANTLTISATGGAGSTDPEIVRDTMAAALVQGTNITITVNDAADTITIATNATQNATDAALRDRSTHTGTQTADTITDGTTNKVLSAANLTKLGGIATAATANATDANLRDRTTHTGTQSADTIVDGTTNKVLSAANLTKLSGIATGATANATDTQLRDRSTHSGTQLAATISDFTEAVQDAVGTALSGSGMVTVTYNDASNTWTVAGSQALTDALALKSDTSTVNAALALKAPLASPTFTGTIVVPDNAFAIAKIALLTARLAKTPVIYRWDPTNSTWPTPDSDDLYGRQFYSGGYPAATDPSLIPAIFALLKVGDWWDADPAATP